MDNFGTVDLSDDTFHKLSNLLYQESGINLKDYKKYLVINRLSKYVGDRGDFDNFEDYYEALKNDKSGDLMINFVNALTTNYSYFFRDEIHFDLLKQYLQSHGSSEPYIRIWSAACSTGEEPYTMAISCLQSLPNIRNMDIKILATDVSTKVLELAKEGSYHYSKVKGHIEEKELRSFFTFNRENNHFIVQDKLKEMIAFRYMNLFDNYPFTKSFDIVFLRNVLIYFDKKEKEIVVNKVSETIKPGGYLILGLSETLVEVNHTLLATKNSIYQKKMG